MIPRPELPRPWLVALAVIIPGLALWALWTLLVTSGPARPSARENPPSVTGERSPAAEL